MEAGAESLGTHVGPVLPGAVPVGGIAEFDVRRKRETERKPRGAVAHLRRLDPHGHGVQLGMPHGGHPHGNPLDRIFARGDAAPEVEPLHGIAQLLQPHPLPAGLRQQQSHSAEIDTLGVTHHPVAQRLLLGIRNVVTHHAPLRLPDGAPELLGGLPLGQRKTIPSPVRHRVRIVGEGLQPADIESEGELAVADLRRTGQVAVPDLGIVPRDDRPTVDSPRSGGLPRQERTKGEKAHRGRGTARAEGKDAVLHSVFRVAARIAGFGRIRLRRTESRPGGVSIIQNYSIFSEFRFRNLIFGL